MSKSSFFDKFTFFQKLKSVKHIEIIVISIFVIILAVVFMSSTKTTSSNKQQEIASLEQYADYLEQKLENVICKINGAGKTTAMLSFDGRITYEYAKEKEETTTSSSVSGGSNSKTTVNEEVIIISQNGKQTPLIVKEIYPPISGVVIVCDGAGDIAVKLNIISAVQTVLGVDANKIQVLAGDGK